MDTKRFKFKVSGRGISERLQTKESRKSALCRKTGNTRLDISRIAGGSIQKECSVYDVYECRNNKENAGSVPSL